MLKEAALKWETKPFHIGDYPMICGWWREHLWPEIPLSSLPEGLIVFAAGVPVVAGFLYLTETDVSIMEWIISDPKSSPFVRSEALNILMEELCNLAKENGARIVFSFFKQPRLVARAEALGFTKTDTEMIHLVREI